MNRCDGSAHTVDFGPCQCRVDEFVDADAVDVDDVERRIEALQSLQVEEDVFLGIDGEGLLRRQRVRVGQRAGLADVDPDARLLPSTAPPEWTSDTLKVFLGRVGAPVNVVLETGCYDCISSVKLIIFGGSDSFRKLLNSG